MNRVLLLSVATTCATTFLGCWPPAATSPSDQTESKTGKKGIIGRTTDDISELQPGEPVVDSKLPTDANPLTGALNSYGPAIETLSRGQIRQTLELYRAEHGDYPKSHDEFMTKIIKAQKIRLPVLPGNRQYKYDVVNHKLVVVEAAN